MIRQALATLLIAAAPALVPAFAFAQTQTVTHPQGETVIEGIPQKVMVTDWAAFDNLDALGVPVAGVPTSNAPPYLAGRVPADAERIGSLQEPDVEAIAAAAPDLVIVAARSRTAYPTLATIAPTIDTSVDNAAVIAGVEANLTTLGRIFGREEKAAELVAALEAKVAAAREAAAGKGTALVVVVTGNRLGLYGPTSRVSWIYNALGVPSAAAAVKDGDHGGDAITFEYLLKTDPDWLFVVDRDAGVGNAGVAEQVLDNELVRQTTFWKEGHVVLLDPAAAYITMNGYGALMLLLDQVIAAYQAG